MIPGLWGGGGVASDELATGLSILSRPRVGYPNISPKLTFFHVLLSGFSCLLGARSRAVAQRLPAGRKEDPWRAGEGAREASSSSFPGLGRALGDPFLRVKEEYRSERFMIVY